jgi:acyl-CoA hydrolase
MNLPKSNEATEIMDHYKLVLPEYLNPDGFLFGGYLLKWIDEVAYITANLEYPGRRFVTIGLDNVVFRHQIEKGEILRFLVERIRVGETSVGYEVKVFGEQESKAASNVLFDTKITFVNVDKSGTKQPLSL